MKKVILSLAITMISSMAYAQNMAVYKAEEQLNEGKIAEAEKTILPTLDNPKTTKLKLAYKLAADVESRILQKEIEKAASKQPLDTTKFILALDKAVECFTKCNELDMAPDKKGHVKPEYHAECQKMIKQMISYYAYAGQFENQRGNKDGAYKSFINYLNLPKNSVFTKNQTDSIYKADKETFQKIGYYATMLAYEKKDYDALLKTVDFAIADPASRNDGYLMKLSALLAKKDTAAWVATSREAVAAVDDNPVYCNNLLFYYNSKNLQDEAKALADELVQKAPNNKMAWYASGCVKMNTFKQYAEARADFDKALELDGDFVEALYNKGVSYVNELISLKLDTDPKSKNYQKTLDTAHEYYGKAQPLFERIRELVPSRTDLWGEHLRSIYLNLDMKDKVKEIEEAITGGK